MVIPAACGAAVAYDGRLIGGYGNRGSTENTAGLHAGGGDEYKQENPCTNPM